MKVKISGLHVKTNKNANCKICSGRAGSCTCAKTYTVEKNPGPPKTQKAIKKIVKYIRKASKSKSKSRSKSRNKGKNKKAKFNAPQSFVDIMTTNAMKFRAKKKKMSVLRGGFMANNSQNSKDCRIEHCEYLDEVVLDNAGNYSTSYTVNPTNAPLFPWLYPIATHFSKYKILNLKYTFKSVASRLATGEVLMAYNNDPLNTGLQLGSLTVLTMRNNQPNASGHIYDNVTLNVQKEHLVSEIGRDWHNTGDITDTTTANVQLICNGVIAFAIFSADPALYSTHVGDISLSFDIVFREPILPNLFDGVLPGNTSYAQNQVSPLREFNSLFQGNGTPHKPLKVDNNVSAAYVPFQMYSWIQNSVWSTNGLSPPEIPHSGLITGVDV